MIRKLFVLAFVCLVLSFANARAQDQTAPKEVQNYVALQGKKQKVPAEVNKIVKGDLNGDGKDDLAVQYYVQIGYPGNATTIATAIFVNRANKYVFAAEIKDNVVPTAIENRVVLADRLKDENSGETIGTVKYKLVGKRLVKTK